MQAVLLLALLPSPGHAAKLVRNSMAALNGLGLDWGLSPWGAQGVTENNNRQTTTITTDKQQTEAKSCVFGERVSSVKVGVCSHWSSCVVEGRCHHLGQGCQVAGQGAACRVEVVTWRTVEGVCSSSGYCTGERGRVRFNHEGCGVHMPGVPSL